MNSLLNISLFFFASVVVKPEVFQELSLLDYMMLFGASIISVSYEMFNKPQDKLDRRSLLAKLLRAIIVSFLLVPAMMEYFNLSLRIGFSFTVILAYGLDELLKATINRGVKTIEKNDN
jgi:hypothetical protein